MNKDQAYNILRNKLDGIIVYYTLSKYNPVEYEYSFAFDYFTMELLDGLIIMTLFATSNCSIEKIENVFRNLLDKTHGHTDKKTEFRRRTSISQILCYDDNNIKVISEIIDTGIMYNLF